MIRAAHTRLRHAPALDAEAFMHLAIAVLRERRAAAEGTPQSVAALLGFTGLPLPDGMSIDLPQGRLRPPAPGEQRYAPFMALADAVLETTVAAEVTDGHAATGASSRGQERLLRLGRDICLAAALSTAAAVPSCCPAVVWMVELPPFPLGMATRPLHPARPGPGRGEPLSATERDDLLLWADRVHEAELDHVAIAIDRLLRALWEPEWTESLIDAVIAWENLFGSTPETAYRVTAALAKLCEDDPEKRPSVRERLSTTYSARSRLVHGSPPKSSVHEHRATAVQFALEAQRRLIADRPDLLMLAKSEDRVDRIILA